MTCKERILSNDYADVIVDYMLPEGSLSRWDVDFCFQSFDEEFVIAYLDRAGLPPLSIGTYTYASIPNLYGLMQTFQADNLVEMGNLRIQGLPLELQGNGVIIGFVDTGERVIILPDEQEPNQIKGSRRFSPTKKCRIKGCACADI